MLVAVGVPVAVDVTVDVGGIVVAVGVAVGVAVALLMLAMAMPRGLMPEACDRVATVLLAVVMSVRLWLSMLVT